MKRRQRFFPILLLATGVIFVLSSYQCAAEKAPETAAAATEQAPTGGGQASVKDEISEQNIVKVAVGSADHTTDSQTLGMANGGKATITKKDGKTMMNDTTILGAVKASNGMVYVIDKVLLPK